MKMMALSAERVSSATRPRMQRRIDRKTRANVQRASRGGGRAIDRRMRELDREWDVERIIEVNAPSLTLLGIGLGVFVNRWFLLLSGAVCAFLIQHALQGWCPPIPLLRRLGVRTTQEIERERCVLQAMKEERGKGRARRRSSRRRGE